MSELNYPWQEAIFSDGTELFRTPMEPEANSAVTVRLRMPNKEGFRAFVLFEGEKIPMTCVRKHLLYELHEASFTLSDRQCFYAYWIETPDGGFCYNNFGLQKEHDRHGDFRITPGYKTPDWAKGAVMYQIFVDRFANGNVDNSVTDREYYYIDNYVTAVPEWNRYPEANDVGTFYGGDLKGIRLMGFRDICGLFYLGLICSAVCYMMWNEAIADIGAMTANLYVYAVPVVTMIASAVFLSEAITWGGAVGVVLVVGGMLLSNVNRRISE